MSHEMVTSAAGGAGESPHSDRASLALLLKRCEQALRARLQDALTAADLQFEQWRILSVLADRPGLRMSEIGEAAVVPAATLTRHMDKLVERALVIRRVDPEDKRRAVCALSGRGSDLVDTIRVEETAAESRLAAGLGPARYEELLRELALALHLFD